MTKVFEEELTAISMIEKIKNRLAEKSFDNLEIVASLLHKQLFVNSPVFQLHFQHVLIIFLSFVQFTAVSYEINHQGKGEWIAINKDTLVLFL